VRNRWFLAAILLGCLTLAAGCGGSDRGGDSGTGDNEEAARTPTTVPRPTEIPFAISDVVWTTGIDEDSGEPIDEVDAFTTVSPRLVAVIEVENVPAGTGFTATWTIDGIEVPEATMEATVDADLSTAWIAFEFIRDEGRYFPLGELEVTITSTTGEEVTGSVDIQLP
jgi:hypothetical protein